MCWPWCVALVNTSLYTFLRHLIPFKFYFFNHLVSLISIMLLYPCLWTRATTFCFFRHVSLHQMLLHSNSSISVVLMHPYTFEQIKCEQSIFFLFAVFHNFIGIKFLYWWLSDKICSYLLLATCPASDWGLEKVLQKERLYINEG